VSIPTPSPSLDIYVTQADYGFLSISTAPGTTCTASATLSDGSSVSGMGGARIADAQGSATWRYLQAPTSAVQGTYAIHCSSKGLQSSVTADFQVGS
jgi:hypothetical protein